MTDFVAATARRGYRAYSAIAAVAFFSVGLGGCETASSVFGNQSASETVAPVAAAPKPAQSKLALAPIVGAPDGVAKQLVSQLGQAAEKNRLSIVGDRDAGADYTLRGYVVAARDKAGTKVSYIWDIADKSGKRVNRISGEELAPGQPNAKDPWINVNAGVTQAIADKTASSLGAWVPSQAPQSSGTPIASAPAMPAAGAGASSVEPPAQTARAVQASSATTAALPKSDDVTAVVPAIAGAPGDGNSALSAALQRELSRQGIALAEKPGAYRVEGKVTLGEIKDGKQPIQIDWKVKDPQGKALGTVSQKNEIPPGSLDGTWGKTADAAAAAAAQGIIKLLPQAKSTN